MLILINIICNMDLNLSFLHWAVTLGCLVALFLGYIIWRVIAGYITVLKTWINGRKEPRVPRNPVPVVCTEDIAEQNGEGDIDITHDRAVLRLRPQSTVISHPEGEGEDMGMQADYSAQIIHLR